MKAGVKRPRRATGVPQHVESGGMERGECVLRRVDPICAGPDGSIVIHIGFYHPDSGDRIEESDEGINGNTEEKNGSSAAHSQPLPHVDRGEESALDFVAGPAAV